MTDGKIEFSFNNQTFKALVTQDGDYRLVFHEGHSFKVKKSESTSFLPDDQGLIADKVIAPMPGVIIQYLVGEGEEVRANQKVLILEAMKMQNEIISQVEGKVKKITVKPGDTVAKDEVLVEIEK